MPSRLVAGIAALLLSASALAQAPVLTARRHGGILLPPTGEPYGQSLGEWSADWWKWALTTPASVNPVLDTTGADCAVGQHGHVWFLAGSSDSAPVVRNCAVPQGRPLFFPVVNAVYVGFPGDPPITRAGIDALLAPFFDGATGLEVLVDGVSVGDISRYFVKSPLFSATAPADPIFGIPADTFLSPCMAEGYHVMLTPLAPGRHTVVIHGRLGSGFAQDVTYHLDVR